MTDATTAQAVQPTDAICSAARSAADHAVEYLLSRQSPNGGFCFYRSWGIEEPSLADTWHALAALTLLGAEIPQRTETLAYVQGFRGTGLDGLYYRTLALECLGVTADPAASARIATLDAAHYLDHSNVPIGAGLRRALQIVSLQRQFASIRKPGTIHDRVSGLRGAGGWGEKPNLPDTWRALEILRACGTFEIPDTTRRFINALQVAPFGFTATPDSNSADLVVVHAGLRACDALRMPVRYPRAAADFLLACQSGNGGFARNPGALPGIDLTHQGVLGLVTIGALPVTDSPGWQQDHGE